MKTIIYENEVKTWAYSTCYLRKKKRNFHNQKAKEDFIEIKNDWKIGKINYPQMYHFQSDFCLNCPLQISLLFAVNFFHKEGFLNLLWMKCENANRI